APHPSRTSCWSDGAWNSVGNVVMFGGPPVDDRGRDDYFESLYYSAAVVGITTSAFLEAAVVGRPVMSFYADDLRPEHEDSLHFQHLADPEHGLLTMGNSLEEHAQQLASVLSGPPQGMMRRQDRFVRTFIRPRGFDISATSVVADALEQLPAARRIGASPASSSLGRLGWHQAQRLERSPRWRHLILDEREIDREARISEKARGRAQELAQKRAAKAQALARKRAVKTR